MGKRLGFKVFVGLFVSVPLITLIMVIGLERSYVEQLEDNMERSDGHSILESRHVKRSTLEKRLEIDTGNNVKKFSDKLQLDADTIGVKKIFVKDLEPNSGSSVQPGAELYQALKKRKSHELRVEKSIRESWWYIRKQLNTLKSENLPSNELHSFVTNTLNIVRDHHNGLRKWYSEVNADSSMGEGPLQLNWSYWQANVSAELRTLMLARLDHLQNPLDCNSAKKLICQVGKTCGFGCQMHHVTYCFILAYASERTLILDSVGWSYNSGGWDSVFNPVTPCPIPRRGSKTSWSMTSTENTVYLPPVDNLSPRPSQLPMAVPRDIVDRLMSFHGFPFAWFTCQFLDYLMRPSQDLDRYLVKNRETIGLQFERGPIVGLHVRRTDKKSEAHYHNVEEYMGQVDEWYDMYELMHQEEIKPVQRRVFIATDEPEVLKEAKDKYPQYEILSDMGITSLASKTSTRYSKNSLYGVIFDVDTLSQCDYIVCTFSSQVCRLAYELMQNRHVDASNKYYSLDDVYYFGGQQGHNVVAIQKHKAPPNQNELSLNIGDLLGIAGNEKNGYSVGRKISTKQNGQYPSYKVEEHVIVADFPTYNNV